LKGSVRDSSNISTVNRTTSSDCELTAVMRRVGVTLP
jgi:hypothetical protein